MERRVFEFEVDDLEGDVKIRRRDDGKLECELILYGDFSADGLSELIDFASKAGWQYETKWKVRLELLEVKPIKSIRKE